MFVSLNNSGACGPATGIGSTYPTERGPSVASVSFERQPRWAPLDGLSENSVRHHPTQQPNAAAVRRRERRGCRAPEGLVQEDAGVRKGEPLALGAGAQEDG